MSVEALLALGMQFVSLECRSLYGSRERAFAVRGLSRVLDILNNMRGQEASDAWRKLYDLWTQVG